MAKETPVKIEVIKIIYDAVVPIHYRLEETIKDLLNGRISFSETEKSILFDYAASAMALKVLFEDYIQQAKEHKVDTIYLPQQEFKSLLGMSKNLETCNRITFHNNVALWSH